MYRLLTALALFVSAPIFSWAMPVEDAVQINMNSAESFVDRREVVSIAVAAELTQSSDLGSTPYGIQLKRGVELALAEAQTKLLNSNLKIELKEFDSSGLAAEDVLQSDVKAVIGHLFSSEALVAAGIYENGPLMFVSPGATADQMQFMGDHVVSTVFNNLEQARMLVEAANEKKLKKAAVISVKDCPYCENLTLHFGVESRRTDLGEIEVQHILSDDEDLGSKLDIEKLKEADLIFLPNYEAINARIIHFLHSKGVRPDYYMGGDGWGLTSDVFRELVKDVNFKAICLGYWSPRLKEKMAADFSARFQAKYSIVPSDSSVLAFDGMNRLIEILLKSERPVTRESLLKAKDEVKVSDGALGKIENKEWVISRPYVILEYNGLEVIETTVKRTEL